MGHPADRRRGPKSWEPVSLRDVQVVGELLGRAAVVEGDVAGAVARHAEGTRMGEIVTWAWVVDPTLQEVLLLDHSYFGRWVPPGGRAQPGEQPLDAVARELAEETGITSGQVHPDPAFVDVVAARTPTGEPVDTFGIAYLHVVDRGVALEPEPDQPVAWWPLDAPPERRAEHHWRRLAHHLRTLG